MDPGRERPGWHGWQGNPDELWPPFSDHMRQLGPPGRGDRLAQHGHGRLQEPRRPNVNSERVRPRLSREQIVDVAIAIADAEGAEALSMRRIAQVLRSGTMSLYWYVSGKEQLLELMRDMLMAEVVVPEPSGDWRQDLRAFAVSSRAMLRRHLWLMDFVGGRPALGPATMLTMDAVLATMDAVPLDIESKLRVLAAVTTYVSGAVLGEAQEIRAYEAEQQAAADIDIDAMLQERRAWRDRLDATGLFPRFVAFIDAGIDPDAPETMDARFEFGLDCLLDGIAARLPSR
jgi:AcrR family transcriptional regulator